jgi:hypothetical protein
VRCRAGKSRWTVSNTNALMHLLPWRPCSFKHNRRSQGDRTVTLTCVCPDISPSLLPRLETALIPRNRTRRQTATPIREHYNPTNPSPPSRLSHTSFRLLVLFFLVRRPLRLGVRDTSKQRCSATARSGTWTSSRCSQPPRTPACPSPPPRAPPAPLLSAPSMSSSGHPLL